MEKNKPVTLTIVSLPERSVTWTNVSLNEAKMWATPKTSSPGATTGLKAAAASSAVWAWDLRAAFPLGAGAVVAGAFSAFSVALSALSAYNIKTVSKKNLSKTRNKNQIEPLMNTHFFKRSKKKLIQKQIKDSHNSFRNKSNSSY